MKNNPILNNPYSEPIRNHYNTNLDGELDYEKIEDSEESLNQDP